MSVFLSCDCLTCKTIFHQCNMHKNCVQSFVSIVNTNSLSVFYDRRIVMVCNMLFSIWLETTWRILVHYGDSDWSCLIAGSLVGSARYHRWWHLQGIVLQEWLVLLCLLWFWFNCPFKPFTDLSIDSDGILLSIFLGKQNEGVVGWESGLVTFVSWIWTALREILAPDEKA